MKLQQEILRFSRQEAQAKLGRHVVAVVALDEVAAGSRGRVMEIDEIVKDGFELIVEWDARVNGKFQHDWFSKEQYERCLIDETNEASGLAGSAMFTQ